MTGARLYRFACPTKDRRQSLRRKHFGSYSLRKREPLSQKGNDLCIATILSRSEINSLHTHQKIRSLSRPTAPETGRCRRSPDTRLVRVTTWAIAVTDRTVLSVSYRL